MSKSAGKVGRNTRLGAACLAVAAVAGLAARLAHMPAAPVEAAQPTPVLVELFTSEGCSSCPPADRLLRELDAKQDVPGAHVLVLSEHVDYWDHLGWRDIYSSPAWTARQQQYASLLRQADVFTPQAVIDGTHDVVGSDADGLRSSIASAAHQPKQPLTIASVEWQGSDVVVTIDGGPYPGANLYAVVADERDRSQVEKGENAGSALEHVAVARALVPVKAGVRSVRIATPYKNPAAQAGHVRVVVFAQARDGRVVAAAERPA